MFMSLFFSSVQNMHDDMADLLEQANEIQETLGRSYAVPDEIDEADLEAGALRPGLLTTGPVT